jgi:hypothetical protein
MRSSWRGSLRISHLHNRNIVFLAPAFGFGGDFARGFGGKGGETLEAEHFAFGIGRFEDSIGEKSDRAQASRYGCRFMLRVLDDTQRRSGFDRYFAAVNIGRDVAGSFATPGNATSRIRIALYIGAPGFPVLALN